MALIPYQSVQSASKHNLRLYCFEQIGKRTSGFLHYQKSDLCENVFNVIFFHLLITARLT